MLVNMQVNSVVNYVLGDQLTSQITYINIGFHRLMHPSILVACM